MSSTSVSLWQRYQQHLIRYEDLGISLDVSRMRFPEDFFAGLSPRLEAAVAAMRELEGGAMANPDEGRMVGHYWLRNADLAPEPALRDAIRVALADVKSFAASVHSGAISGSHGHFTNLLVIGIGGSALGPQFVNDALSSAGDRMRVHYFDNTDPEGMDRVLRGLNGRLGTTLAVVISKSGGTKETRNGMLEAENAWKKAGLNPGVHFVAVTGEGSELDKHAEASGWLKRFPMWDWVGGRTSVMSTVGLVPMALQGLDIDAFLAGAAAMDAKTREGAVCANASLMLAAMWYYAGDGRGRKDMVILPYKDRLVLFSKYLQQLVMESLGKERDLEGNVVHQGIAVYGNKGSTDQHAYVQQLRDGIPNFFATFIEVREGRDGAEFEVEPGVTSADYLQGFLRGTRSALYEGGRDSITISVPKVDAFQVGALVALYERAVGFYATLVGINAYHQPGVEAGKKAAGRVLAMQMAVVGKMVRGQAMSAEEVAGMVDGDPEDAHHILTHLAANGRLVRTPGETAAGDRFELKS